MYLCRPSNSQTAPLLPRPLSIARCHSRKLMERWCPTRHAHRSSPHSAPDSRTSKAGGPYLRECSYLVVLL
jgi:hypothetical protein